eukprot:CAMPEP_0198250900 /NCGR_PEP_ID=MMETSP1447-20131203/1915_1 /TAXON_ID=420782 /ORGANISM="Chaetoceros dichaeta, Strain CCMP1751" /LENGTH=211 /DNA_ID=CAMNT_0043935807 /DNA_START=33 /DNA_END=668 /DNA_ORIENTATION=+
MVQKKQRPVLRFSVFINAFILACVCSIGVVDSFMFPAKGYPKMQDPTILYATEKQQETKTPCPLLPPVENVEEYADLRWGDFGGPQRDFDRTEGIIDTVVGYSGSIDPINNPNPTYQSIKGYAESIRIRFDRTKVTYSDVLDMFFAFHTPTNPRFSGSQYRSAIFCLSPDQHQAAEETVKARGALGKFIAVEDSSDFYRGEEYHQKYMEKF